KLWPVHPLPGRHREGRQAHGTGAVGRGPAQRAVDADARCFDLRPGSGRTEPAALRAEVLPRGAAEAPGALVIWTSEVTITAQHSPMSSPGLTRRSRLGARCGFLSGMRGSSPRMTAEFMTEIEA